MQGILRPKMGVAKPDFRLIHGEAVHGTLYERLIFNNGIYTLPESESIIIFGSSGSGKERRGEFLAEYFGLDAKVSSGEIFRNLKKKFGEEVVPAIKEKRDALERDPGSLEEFAENHDKVLGFFRDRNFESGNEFEAVALFQSTCGLFVRGKVYLDLMRQAFATADYKGKRLVYDGHIRTKDQVEPIMEMIAGTGYPLHGVFVVHADLDIVQERTVGRRSCPIKKCKLEYNVSDFASDGQFPPERDGKFYCEEHPEEELIHRDDDHEGPVERRLGEYTTHANPTLHALGGNGERPLRIVTGDLNPYSRENLERSVLEAKNGDNRAVLERFARKSVRRS